MYNIINYKHVDNFLNLILRRSLLILLQTANASEGSVFVWLNKKFLNRVHFYVIT